MKLKEIYGNLARLLSNENLTVIHKNNVDTASFDAVKRVLTLPVWEGLSDDAYQLLVGHETGHALYSPHSSPDQHKDIPEACIQVIEDARIEKLMKRRYPGMKRTFYNGYRFLHNKGFFDIGGQDINDMGLADRINLYFKIGSLDGVDKINFTKEEKALVDEIEATETFEDVLAAAKKLYKMCKDQFQSSQGGASGNGGDGSQKQKVTIKMGASGMSMSGGGMSIPMPQGDSGDGSDDSDGQGDDGDSEDSDGSNGDQGSNGSSESESDQSDGASSGQQGSTEVEDQIKTNSSLQEALKKLVKPGPEIHYVTEPKLDLDKYIVSPDVLTPQIEAIFKFGNTEHADQQAFDNTILEYNQFKKDSRKEVSYLVKEFECKKAADAYSRINESKTGVLDTLTIHTYKYNEDIFKKNTTVPEGKNHGLIFILDWSGSMDHCILPTCKQLFKLIWFCRQVSIPFEVYAFSSSYKSTNYNRTSDNKSHNTIFLPPGSVSLLNFISSKSKASKIDRQMQNLYSLAHAVSATTGYHLKRRVPNKLGLSGTPLNETLICLKSIIPQFQQKNRIQKLNCIVLSDGEGAYLNRIDSNCKSYGLSTIDSDCFFLDEKLKTTYHFPNNHMHSKYTDVFIKNLKDNYPNVNFIGMRLVNNNQFRSFIRMHTDDNRVSTKLLEDFERDRSCSIKTTEYSSYFGISIASLNSDSSKFTTLSGMMKTMKLNTKILSEFVSIIA